MGYRANDGGSGLTGRQCMLRSTVNQVARGKGIPATCWVNAFNKEGAHKHRGLGFGNRPRI
jgi:hypothetical protein